MMNFSPLRTARLQVDMHELSARDAIALCQMPAELAERGTTELIRRTVNTPEQARRGQETDQRLWSVQERALVVAHYLAHVIDADFKIGSSAKFSDYLSDGGIGAPPDPVKIGSVFGKEWMMQPLLGWHAEAIERLIFSDELQSNRNGWMMGAMAAQLYPVEDGPLDCVDLTDALIDQALTERATMLVSMPESVFMGLVHSFYETMPKLDHTFSLAIVDDGFAFLPMKEVPGIAPARFLFSTAVREDTADVFGAGA